VHRYKALYYTYKIIVVESACTKLNMGVYIAIKRGPIHLSIAENRVLTQRLDQVWWLPKVLHQRLPFHVDIVIVVPCFSVASCDVCARITDKKYKNNHYLTYTVNEVENRVFRQIGKHIFTPKDLEVNNCEWVYYKIPLRSTSERSRAMWFMEQQINKLYNPRSHWIFLCCCKRYGATWEDNETNFDSVQKWYCSELAAAMLMNCCTAFYDHNIYDPGYISPCRLEALLQSLAGCSTSKSICVLPALFV
jgi:hypothetical protein